MVSLIKKVKKGKAYYYIKESARVNGKPRTVNQIYLGSIERIMDMALGHQNPSVNKIQSQEFGSLFLANAETLLEILRKDPYQSPPPYEKLIGDLTGAYSRRINIQHRLVYQVIDDEKVVNVIRMWTHYE